MAKKRFIVIAVVCMLVALLVTVGLLILFTEKKQTANESNKQTTQTSSNQLPQAEQKTPETVLPTSPCKKNWTEYASQQLGIRFCYPSSWGTANVADAKIDPSDRGTRFSVRFAEKQPIAVTVVSQDWVTDVGRGIACNEIAVQSFPVVQNNPSNKWQVDSSEESAQRVIESTPDQFFLQENVSTLESESVCLKAFIATGGEVYSTATATYGVGLGGAVASVKAHIANPTNLISATDRADFTEMSRSLKKF